jgi:hypothetical protein
MTESLPDRPPLGPALGRLARPPQGSADDGLRLTLVDRLIQSEPLGGGDWVRIWRETATEWAGAVLEEASDSLRRAATRSRLPGARLAALLPDPESHHVLVERICAEAMALEDLAGEPFGAATTRRRGATLAAAWEGAAALVAAERARWRERADTIGAWRRPWRPLVVTALMLLSAAALAALWIGGWVPTPSWFQPVVSAFWDLPWP